MKHRYLSLLIILIFVVSSCAKNIYVNYQSEPSQTSRILIKPGKIAHKTDITINDSLIVDCKKIRSVTINNVPAGNYQIKVKSSSTWYTERLNSSFTLKTEGDGKTIVKEVKVPPHSTWYWVAVTSMVVWPLVILAVIAH